MTTKTQRYQRQSMTLKARAKHLYSAFDRSGQAFSGIARNEKMDLVARVKTRIRSGIYALVAGMMHESVLAKLSEEEVRALLNGILVAASGHAAKEVPEEPVLEEGTVEDTEKACKRWATQAEVTTYRQIKLTIENVLKTHDKAVAKHAQAH